MNIVLKYSSLRPFLRDKRKSYWWLSLRAPGNAAVIQLRCGLYDRLENKGSTINGRERLFVFSDRHMLEA